MRKKILSMICVSLALCSPLFAEDAIPEPNTGLIRTLQANRSLLKQYHAEYMGLKNDQTARPSGITERKLKNLEVKIKALEEDSEELQSFLPVSRQAQAFISDLMNKKTSALSLKKTQEAGSFVDEAALKHAMPLSSPEAETTGQMHERALRFVSEKRFKDAIKLYEDIVLKNPDDDEAYVIMGHTYLLMGQYQKAERAFHNAASIDPQNIQEITPFYENAVLQNPDDDIAYANLGYASLILGDLLKAKNAFTESLRINPSNLPAQNGLMVLDRLARNQ